jgi:FHA domain
MSLRLFVYYCALSGGGGALLGWAGGRILAGNNPPLRAGIQGLMLGVGVAFALSLVDSLWSLTLRRSPVLAKRVGTAVLVGAVGGFVGGLLSQKLYDTSRFLGFALGWGLTGLLVGAAPGVFDLVSPGSQDRDAARRKVLKGLVGGAVGGFLGGALSLLLRQVWTGLFASRPDNLLWSPSAFGFAALGGSIGLLIGLAQVILNEAWVRVEAGFRPGREVILARPVITVGKAENADIALFGDPEVERVHARLVRQGHDYVLRDAGSLSGTYVNGQRVSGERLLRNGDTIRLGRSQLRFRERRKR